jgi:hypothetical protein
MKTKFITNRPIFQKLTQLNFFCLQFRWSDKFYIISIVWFSLILKWNLALILAKYSMILLFKKTGKDFYRLKKLLNKFPLYKDSTLVGPDVNSMDECPENSWVKLMMVKVTGLFLFPFQHARMSTCTCTL